MTEKKQMSRRSRNKSNNKKASQYQRKLIENRRKDIENDIEYVQQKINDKFNIEIKIENQKAKIAKAPTTNTDFQPIASLYGAISSELYKSYDKQKKDYINLRMKKNLEKIHIKIDNAINKLDRIIGQARKFFNISSRDIEDDDEDEDEVTNKNSRKKKIIKSNGNLFVKIWNGKDDFSIDETETMMKKLIKFDEKIQSFFNSLDSASTISNIESAIDNLIQALNDFEDVKEFIAEIQKIQADYQKNYKSIDKLNNNIELSDQKQSRMENREKHLLKTWESYKTIVKDCEKMEVFKNKTEYRFNELTHTFFDKVRGLSGAVKRLREMSSNFDANSAFINKILKED